MDRYVVISMVEGVMIVCMLGWEIYWLRRMYQVLNQMPTQGQVGEMIEFLKKSIEKMGDMAKPIGGLVEMVKGFFPKIGG